MINLSIFIIHRYYTTQFSRSQFCDRMVKLMSTLVRNLSIFVLMAIFFGCFFFIQSTGCLAQTNLNELSVPFCTAEHFSTPFFLKINIDQKAVLVQKLLLFLVVLSSILILQIPKTDFRVHSVYKLLYLVRFGPYQKRYTIILPSYQ